MTNTWNSDIAGVADATGGPDAITWPNELGEAPTTDESPKKTLKQRMKQKICKVACLTWNLLKMVAMAFTAWLHVPRNWKHHD